MISEKNGEIIKATTQASLLYASTYYPSVLVAGPVLSKIIDRFVEKPKQILIEEMNKSDQALLNEEQLVSIYPMVHRYLEAAKQGETDGILRILAEFIVNEMKESTPDPSALTRASRALEGLSFESLKVLAASYKFMREGPSEQNCATDVNGTPLEYRSGTVEAVFLAKENFRSENTQTQIIEEALADLSARGLVYESPNNDGNRPDVYFYHPTRLGREVIEKAKRTLSEAETKNEA